MVVIYIVASVGLALGNFVWQILNNGHNWGVAAERSFFQIVAVFTVFIMEKFFR